MRISAAIRSTCSALGVHRQLAGFGSDGSRPCSVTSFEKAGDGGRQLVRPRNPGGSHAGRREFIRNRGEIFHVRADDHRFREIGRLENIVASAGGQSASHEDDVGAFEQRGQLADGIEQQYSGVCSGAGAAERRLRRATRGMPARWMAFPQRRRNASGLRGARIRSRPGRLRAVNAASTASIFVRIGRLLGRHGAGGDPNGLGLPSIEEAGDVRWNSGSRRSEIVFEIARARYPIGGRARNHKTAGIFRGLGEDRVGKNQGVAEEAARRTVTRQGPVGDAAVDDHEGGSGALGFAI